MVVAALSRFRVLHTVDTYLPRTENWIYPQITRVPNVESAVLCNQLQNVDEFPLQGRPCFLNGFLNEQSPKFVPRVVRAIMSRTGWVRNAALVRAYLWSPHLIHAHFGTSGWSLLRAKAGFRVPLITTFYGYDAWALPTVDNMWRNRFKLLFAKGDIFLVEGPAMKYRLRDLGCPEGKIFIWRLGVDLRNIPHRIRDFSDDLRIIMVGRFTEKKGFVTGLRACAMAAEAGVRLTVTIIGDASENDPNGQSVKCNLLSIADLSSIKGRVRFTGFISVRETRDLIQAHDILICPSQHAPNGDAEGGSPVVLTEAQGMGLLCIGSRHCDIPEIIINGKTGFLFDEGDIEALANILKGLPSLPSACTQMSQAGRRLVESKFNLVLQLKALEQTYAGCIKRAMHLDVPRAS